MDATFYKNRMYGGGGAVRGNFYDPIIYSTEEREVGVWTDNKPLYQKTFIITSKQSQIDISSLNIDTYVKSESVYRIGSYCFEMPRLSDSTQNYNAYISTYYAELNSGNINFLWGTNVSSVDELHFTIQYTKTTDVAGSGKYNTLGVPNVHYDGNEKVIGTWFGETLYEKTIDVGTLPNNTTKLVSIDSNIDLIISFEGFAYSTTDRTYQRPLPMVGSSNAIIRIDRNGNDLRIITYDNWTTYKGFITIQYTKTTD